MRVANASAVSGLIAIVRRRRRRTLSAATVAGAVLAAVLAGVLAGSGAAAVPTCFGQSATMVGTSSADTLTGTAGDDVIAGLGGDDTILGGGGNDLICAGSGDDGVNGGAGDDRIMGEDGYDLIVAGPGADYVDAGAGNDAVYGGAGADELHGGLGSDYVRGGEDDDTLLGDDNDDALYGDAGTDTVTGGAGSDLCVGTTRSGCETLAQSGPCPPAFATEIGVRDPSRLTVSNACYSVTGTVTREVLAESDGDRTFNVTADGSGEVLHVEFMPRDAGHFVLPATGSRISLVGARAKDEHGKLEIHAAFQETYQATTYLSGPQYAGNPKKSNDTPCWTEAGADCSWDTTPPTAPTGLTATAASPTQVDLRWTTGTDDVAVTSYVVFRDGTQIATSSTTSYSDTTVTGGRTYSYTVRARDGAGNTSADSNTATVTTPTTAPSTRTLTFRPTDDATIVSGSSSTNYGSATTLTTDASPRQDYLLKFALSAIGTSRVISAKLRLYCVDTSNGGGNYHRVANTSWKESTVTWSNAPAADAAVLGSLGAVKSSTRYEVDVTPLVTGDGTVSVRVDTVSTDGAAFSSDEGANPPQLVVTVADQSSGDTQPPTAPTGLSGSASSATQVDLSWTAATDDRGVVGYDIYRGPAGGSLALVASTGAVTSYADTTAAAGTGYDYQVKAFDAAGNRSPPSNTATVTTPGSSSTTTLTFGPEADANVKEASPSSNYGTDTTLKADGGTGAHIASYLRFTVTGVAAGQTVQSAVLRLYVPSDGTADGPPVYGAGNSWSETAITWTNRPFADAAATNDLGAIAAGSWVQYGVTPLVTGAGTFTFVVGPSTTTDGVVFSSREASSNTPQLVVTVSG